MNDLQDLELLIHSETPIIYIQSNEEKRISELVVRLGKRVGKEAFHWSVIGGLRKFEAKSAIANTENTPDSALQYVAQSKSPSITVLFDIHPYLDEPVLVRQLRELAKEHQNNKHTLILVSPHVEIPDELKMLSAFFELSLPNDEEIRAIIVKESERWGKKNNRRVQAKQEIIDAIVRNLKGLGFSDTKGIIRKLINDDGILGDDDIKDAIKAKYETLDSDGVLSFETKTVTFDQVAGLSNLKEWLNYRKKVFLSEKAPVGLDTPKGLLLLGVQGGGKSLAAKSVAGGWNIPLLRLDFAALYNKYYGETERNLRDALKTAEVMQPCVLWIDEIEKGLSTESEGGPAQRVLGTLLTWMAERDSKVFLVATANDIESLPPELLRKGRFDEIFFVDLPDHEVRSVIFKIHLNKREKPAGNYDLDKLADASEGFAGAEIEQAVVASIYTSFAKDEDLTTEHILHEIKNTKPLSVLMAEKIQYLRDWAKDRTVPAD